MTDTSSRCHGSCAGRLGRGKKLKPLLSELVANEALTGAGTQYFVRLSDLNLCRAVIGDRQQSNGILPKLRSRLCVAQRDVLHHERVSPAGGLQTGRAATRQGQRSDSEDDPLVHVCSRPNE